MSTKAETARPRAPDTKKVHIADTLMTRSNWHKHVNWLNVFLILGIPAMGCIQAFWTPLQWKTAVWAVGYYFFTGLGITAGKSKCLENGKEEGKEANVLQDTIVFGLTALTPLVCLCVSGSPLLAAAPSRAPSAGGLVATALTTDTPTPTRTLTPSARASGTPTSAGWS